MWGVFVTLKHSFIFHDGYKMCQLAVKHAQATAPSQGCAVVSVCSFCCLFFILFSQDNLYLSWGGVLSDKGICFYEKEVESA